MDTPHTATSGGRVCTAKGQPLVGKVDDVCLLSAATRFHMSPMCSQPPAPRALHTPDVPQPPPPLLDTSPCPTGHSLTCAHVPPPAPRTPPPPLHASDVPPTPTGPRSGRAFAAHLRKCICPWAGEGGWSSMSCRQVIGPEPEAILKTALQPQTSCFFGFWVVCVGFACVLVWLSPAVQKLGGQRA